MTFLNCHYCIDLDCSNTQPHAHKEAHRWATCIRDAAAADRLRLNWIVAVRERAGRTRESDWRWSIHIHIEFFLFGVMKILALFWGKKTGEKKQENLPACENPLVGGASAAALLLRNSSRFFQFRMHKTIWISLN